MEVIAIDKAHGKDKSCMVRGNIVDGVFIVDAIEVV